MSQYLTCEKTEYAGELCMAVTGHTGTPRGLTIPESLNGLPVRIIAPHAFEKAAHLQQVALPDSVRVLGSFSFHGCPALTEFVVSDAVADYHDGALRACSALHLLAFTVQVGNYRLLRDILADSDRSLLVRLRFGEAFADPAAKTPRDAELFFPGYVREAREDTFARTIHFATEGTGVAYRECVLRAGIDWADYDRLFATFGEAFLPEAGDICLLRLRSGYHLRKDYAERYRAYLEAHAGEMLQSLLTKRDTEGIRTLLEEISLSGETLRNGILLASRLAMPEIVALLSAQKEEKTSAKYQEPLATTDW